MDSKKILGNLIPKRSSENVGQKFSEKLSIKSKNDNDSRKEHKQVNQSILKNIMHEWTTVVEDPTVVNNTDKVKIDVCKPGVARNAWQIHKEHLLQDDSMAGEMMRILCAGSENSSKPNPEDEYKESIARLQQERSDRMHHEQIMSRRRMNNKIKSKGFHRHAKRRDLKEFLKNEEKSGVDGDDDKLKSKLLQFEKIRAQERISLKHKIGGKFAKIQKLRAKYDPNARDALDGMREKGKELTVKMNDDDSDSDESEGGEEEKEEDESDISDDDDEEEEESQDEEMVAASGRSGEMENSASHKAKSFVEKNSSKSKEEEAEEKNVKTKGKVSSTISTNQSSFLNFQNGVDFDMEESGEVVDNSEEAARFKEAIYEIYQQDSELAEEFEKQKSELVEKENPSDLQLFLRGWGSWTGEGFEAADKRRMQRGLIKAPDTNRKDKKKNRVWIKQGVHDGLKKHLIKSIPFPYNTAEQFNLSRKELVSSTFNFQTVHRELVKPKFVNNAGQHIYPRQKLEKKIN